MKNICIFGDSVSKGVMWDNNASRYTLAKNCFVSLVSRSLSLNVKNFSRLGCTITTGREIMEKHLSQISTSDITVLEFGGNDCDFDWEAIAKSPEELHLPKTPVSEFCDQYRQAVEKVRALGSVPVILDLPPIHAGLFFDYVSRGKNAENILRWLGGSRDFIYRWHEMYNMQVCALANRMKVMMVDVRSAFLKNGDYASLLCADGMHPNEKGHQLISQQINAFALQYA